MKVTALVIVLVLNVVGGLTLVETRSKPRSHRFVGPTEH
jgi:hypothetical protein